LASIDQATPEQWNIFWNAMVESMVSAQRPLVYPIEALNFPRIPPYEWIPTYTFTKTGKKPHLPIERFRKPYNENTWLWV
jgi:hypothetical protein